MPVAAIPRAFARMSAIWSSIQSPGSRDVTISLRPFARRARSSPDIVSCALTRTLLELNDPIDPIHQAAVHRLDVIRQMIETHADQAGAQDPENTSYQLQGLLMGAIVSATRGDLAAARRARAVAELVLADATMSAAA